MAKGLGSDPANTKGRRALQRLLASVSQGEVGRTVGVNQATVSYWASGQRRPGAAHRRQLEKHYAIAEHGWMTREEYLGERAAS